MNTTIFEPQPNQKVRIIRGLMTDYPSVELASIYPNEYFIESVKYDEDEGWIINLNSITDRYFTVDELELRNKTPQTIYQKLAEYLHHLSDRDEFWKSINPNFSHQYCFQDYDPIEVIKSSELAEEWYKSHKWILGKDKFIKNFLKNNTV